LVLRRTNCAHATLDGPPGSPRTGAPAAPREAAGTGTGRAYRPTESIRTTACGSPPDRTKASDSV